jgi:hypothetical protein
MYLPQAPIHCNTCITIFDPNFLGIDTTYKKLSLHVKSVYERLLKKIKSLSMGKNFGICQENICRYLGNSQKTCSSV